MTNPYELAFHLSQMGVAEMPGEDAHPFVRWCLSRVGFGLKASDETAWCSAFVNTVHEMCGLPRSKSAAARSWLAVGTPIELADWKIGDVVIITRGDGPQPGPEVISAQGHVGFLADVDETVKKEIAILGGNQGNRISVARFPVNRLLGVRRCA
jgi:uncharacterized protein (TIGR02594 family)